MRKEIICRPLCCLCVVIFTAGLLAALVGGEKYAVFICQPPPSGETVLEGKAVHVERSDNHQKIYLKNVHINIQGQSSQLSGIIIYDKHFQDVNIGDALKVEGEVFLFEGSRNPGEFDAKRYYRSRNIAAGMWSRNVSITEESRFPFAHSLSEFRRSWSELLKKEMGERNGAVLSAILLGDKSAMADEVKSLYRLNGISHILAISGLHLSLIGMGIYEGVRRRTGSYILAAVAGTLFLGLYVMMIGESLSAMRAMIMFLFKVGAQCTGRKYDSPTALWAAAAIIAVWRPLSVTEGGFWLSFGAAAGMLVTSRVFRGWRWEQLGTGFGINVVMIPVQIRQFSTVPLYGSLTNFLVIPLMSVLLGMGLLGSGLLVVSQSLPLLTLPARGILGICSGILTLYEVICRMVLKLPWAVIATGHREMWQILVYYACLLGILGIFCQCRGSAGRKVRLSLLPAIVGMTVLLVKPVLPGGVEITMLDVGQGDGFCIQTPSGKVCMIDGGSSSRKETGRYIIEPFLLYEGKTTVDYWILSHGDKDHISGVEEILEEKYTMISIRNLVFPPEAVWDDNLKKLAETAEKKGVRVLVCKMGDELVDSRMKMTCLGPVPGDGYGELEKGNPASAVFHLKYGDFDMLFTGDLEGEGEKQLIPVLREKRIKWEVLKIAHHGSGNATGEEFLEVINPSVSLISVGEKNPYGHPHKETLRRIRARGGRLWETRRTGAVKIIVDDRRISIDNWKTVHLQ